MSNRSDSWSILLEEGLKYSLRCALEEKIDKCVAHVLELMKMGRGDRDAKFLLAIHELSMQDSSYSSIPAPPKAMTPKLSHLPPLMFTKEYLQVSNYKIFQFLRSR